MPRACGHLTRMTPGDPPILFDRRSPGDTGSGPGRSVQPSIAALEKILVGRSFGSIWPDILSIFPQGPGHVALTVLGRPVAECGPFGVGTRPPPPDPHLGLALPPISRIQGRVPAGRGPRSHRRTVARGPPARSTDQRMDRRRGLRIGLSHRDYTPWLGITRSFAVLRRRTATLALLDRPGLILALGPIPATDAASIVSEDRPGIQRGRPPSSRAGTRARRCTPIIR